MSVQTETNNSPVNDMDLLASEKAKDYVLSNCGGPKGITFSGETFVVPETHDMVKTLFDPSIRKSNLELVILTCLCANLLVFLIPLNKARIVVFIGLYIFGGYLTILELDGCCNNNQTTTGWSLGPKMVNYLIPRMICFVLNWFKMKSSLNVVKIMSFHHYLLSSTLGLCLGNLLI